MSSDGRSLDNGILRIRFDQHGRWVELFDHRLRRSFIEQPLDWWRLIVDDGLCSERDLSLSHGQPQITSDGVELRVTYAQLRDATGSLPILAMFCFRLNHDAIEVTAQVHNDGPAAGRPGAFAIAEVPHYTAALKLACVLRNALPGLLFDGLFRDEDGLQLNAQLRGKVYQGDRRSGVVIWNRTAQPLALDVTLMNRAADQWHALGSDGPAPMPAQISAGALGVAVFDSANQHGNMR